MTYLILKAVHIIFVVTWFAALFYIVRLFIYSAEASELTDENAKRTLIAQFAVMQRRLWLGIGWPSAIVTFCFGAGLVSFYSPIPEWLWLKLLLVALLYAYHASCHFIYKQQQQLVFRYSSYQLRIWNEVATLFLFSIVFIVIFKDQLSILVAGFSILSLAVILFFAIRFFSKKRLNK